MLPSSYDVQQASRAEALALFDRLAPVSPSTLRGRFRGAGLHTGHPLDGLLEAYGWYGKEFVDEQHVHPLLFGDRPDRLFTVNPARLPFSLSLALPVPKFAAMKYLFRWSRPVFSGEEYYAHLELRSYRGQSSAAMVYNTQPIVDHFRRFDDDHLLGLMELDGSPGPLFFRLARDLTSE